MAPLTAAGSAQSESGVAVFILLVLIAGSISAGLFFATPLVRRARRGRSRPVRDEPSGGQPWSTTAPAPSPPGEGNRSAGGGALGEPWSTGPADEAPPLQRDR